MAGERGYLDSVDCCGRARIAIPLQYRRTDDDKTKFRRATKPIGQPIDLTAGLVTLEMPKIASHRVPTEVATAADGMGGEENHAFNTAGRHILHEYLPQCDSMGWVAMDGPTRWDEHCILFRRRRPRSERLCRQWHRKLGGVARFATDRVPGRAAGVGQCGKCHVYRGRFSSRGRSCRMVVQQTW